MLEWGTFSAMEASELVLHHGLVQSFRGKEKSTDPAYAALVGVSRAASWFAQRVDERFYGPPLDIAGIPFSDERLELTVPVIAVDGQLYEASPDPGAEVALAMLQHASVVTPHPSGGRSMLVTVVSSDGLEATLGDFTASADAFLDQIKEGHEDLLSFLRGPDSARYDHPWGPY